MSRPPPTLLIVNRRSGRGRGGRRLADLTEALARNGRLFESVETEAAGHATSLAKEAAEEGVELVVACGGDGTLSEAAQGLAGSRCALAVYPCGTGNDFARHFRIAQRLRAIEAVLSGENQAIDLIRWKTASGTGWCLNVAGTGFDAAVAERVNLGFRSLRGTFAYLAAVASTLISFEPPEMRIEVDGEAIEGRIMLAAVANASSYGGGMRIAPDADVTDSLLDVVTIDAIGRAEFIRAFPRVFRGTHISHRAATVRKCRTVSITSTPAAPVLCDGERVGTTPVTFESVPNKLLFRRPAVMAGGA